MTAKKRNATKPTPAKTKVAKRATTRPTRANRGAAAGKRERRRGTAGAPAKRQSKKAIVATLLGRRDGASIDELTTATGWQGHSIRAALTGLRKAGHEIARSKDDAGTTRYRLAGAP